MADCVEALKQWTGKSTATTIFDSTVDEFTDDGLFNKVQGQPNIALIGFTTDGDVFGGFYSVAVTQRDECIYDSNIFVFSFESHGRCETPQRFAVKEVWKQYANVRFWKNNNNHGFVVFWVDGAGGFYLGNERFDSFCYDLSHGFEGIQDTTPTGKSGLGDEDEHSCTRLIAIQLS